MIEVGIEKNLGIKDIKVSFLIHWCFRASQTIAEHAFLQSPKSTPGHRILMSFQSSLFSTHPTFQLLKSMLLDFYNGHELSEIPLQGIETVMTVTAGPMDGDETGASTAAMALQSSDPSGQSKEKLPLVHIRVYTTKFLASGTKVPKVALTEMGPRLDLSIRRTQQPDTDMWKEATKRPKMDKKQIESGQGKKRKNIETDDMGDLVGKVHVGKQDLGGLKGRKMKALKLTKDERAASKKSHGDEMLTED